MRSLRWELTSLFDEADTEGKSGAVALDDDETRDVGSGQPARKERATDDNDDDLEEDSDDAEAEETADAEEEDASVLAYLKSQGLDLKADNDEAALQELIGRQRAAEEERQRYQAQVSQYQGAMVAQQQAQYQQQAYQFWAAQQQALRAQQQRQYAGMLAHWNKVPEYNEQWLQYIDRDEQGNLIVKPGGDPTLPQKIQERQAWERQGLQSLLQDPVTFAGQAVFANPVFHSYVGQQVNAAVAQVMDEIKVRDCLQQIDGFMLELKDGKPQPTPFNQAYTQAANYVSQYTSDVMEIHRFSLRQALPYLQQQAAQQTLIDNRKKPEDGKTKRFNILRQQATRTSGRGGTLPNGRKKAPQNPKADIETQLAEAFSGLTDEDFGLN